MKSNSSIFLVFILSLCCYLPLSAQNILWDTKNLHELKANPGNSLYKNTVELANWYSAQMPATVTRKGQSFSGDYHNYESLSIYTWPDSNNPSGPWVTRQGYINPQYKEYDFERLLHLENVIRHFALSYYLTNDDKYHEAAKRWITTWFIDPDTYMYPQMEYAQVRPGDYGNHGTPWGIIEAYTLVNVFEAYQLMNGIKPFDKETTTKVHAWVKDFSDWLQNSALGKLESTMENMHSMTYDVMLFYFASFNNDKKLMKVISNRIVDERMAKQIDDKGMMPFEMNGNRVFHDHLYNLQRIVDFCIIQKNMGKKFYKQNQKLIDSVFDFMMPYMKAPDTFPYPQVSDWDTDISDFKIELLRMCRLNKKYCPLNIGYEADPFETEATLLK